MSRLELPLQHRKLWATGDVLLWADLDLLIKDNAELPRGWSTPGLIGVGTTGLKADSPN
jgi:hypothetical protein